MKMLVTFLMVLMTSTSFAADSSSGCGVGWMVFKDNSLVSSFFRAATNATFLNTVAMTFGTSGCAKHSIVMNDKSGIHFVEANQHQLVVEMAKGRGEYVSAMGYVLGCRNLDLFSAKARSNYNNIFSKDQMSASEIYQNIKNSVKADKDLSLSCNVI